MSKLWMKWFGGMVPRRGEQHLTDKRLEETGIFRRAPENPNFEIESGINATEAEDCNLYSGELRPLKKPALAHTFCRPGDECWRVPIPDDPSVPPPEPPPEPPFCVPVVITGQPGPVPCLYYVCNSYEQSLISNYDYVWPCNDLVGSTTVSEASGGPALIFNVGTSYTFEYATSIPDSCVGTTSLNVRGFTRMEFNNDAVQLQGSVTTILNRLTTYYGSIARIFMGGTVGTNYVEIDSNGTTELVVGFYTVLTGGGLQADEVYTNATSGNTHAITLNYSLDGAGGYTIEVFVDYISIGVRTGDFNGGWDKSGNSSIDFGGGSGMNMNWQLIGYQNTLPSAEEMAVLANAWEQNKIGYTDPNPDCRDPL